MNRLHSHGLKELVLDLKENEYIIGVSREQAPIYTTSTKYNGYEHARTNVIVKKKPDFTVGEKVTGTIRIDNSYDAIRIGDYVFTGDVKITYIDGDAKFQFTCDKMVIAIYPYEFL